MPKHMLIKEDGNPVFFDDNLHKPEQIPEGTIIISDEMWMDFLRNQGERKWNPVTKKFDVVPIPPDDPIPPDPVIQLIDAMVAENIISEVRANALKQRLIIMQR